MYQYWQDRAGETYAVRIESGHVTGVCGPLHYSEVTAANLPNMHYDDEPESAEYIDAHQDKYRLYELQV